MKDTERIETAPGAPSDRGDGPPDVVVIGAGLAGSLAACRARDAGARVLLVRGARDATTLFSGLFDIGPAREEFDVGAALTNLLVSNRHHPFQSLLRHAQGLKDLVEAVQATFKHLRDALDQAGLRLGGGSSRPRLLTTPLGSTRPTFYALATQEAGDLQTMRGADLLAVGFSGMWGYDAEAYATALTRAAPARFHAGRVHSIEIDLPEGVRSMVDLAELLDRPEDGDPFIERIVRATKGRERVALPPCIGIRHADHLIEELDERTGARCFETLAAFPSVPGIRLRIALEKMLEASGVEVIEGKARGTIDDGAVSSLVVRRDGVDLPIDAGAIVLATGRHIGGGIRGDVDAVFGLPADRRSLARARRRSADQLTLGVSVGPDLRPVDRTGMPVAERLYAAGPVIGGYDPASETCGAGVEILTGYLAGRNAATEALRS